MAQAAPLLYFAAAAATATTTAIQIDEAKNARQEAGKANADNQAAATKLLEEQKSIDLNSQAKGSSIATRDAQRARQDSLRRAAGGRQGTLLTTPFGADSVPTTFGATSGTTLLGG